MKFYSHSHPHPHLRLRCPPRPLIAFLAGIAAALLLASWLAAQAPAPAPKPSDKPPTISADTIKRFWIADDAQQRTQRQLKDAQEAAQAAIQDFQGVVKAMQDACGANYQLTQDTVSQDPYCKAKPPADKKGN